MCRDIPVQRMSYILIHTGRTRSRKHNVFIRLRQRGSDSLFHPHFRLRRKCENKQSTALPKAKKRTDRPPRTSCHIVIRNRSSEGGLEGRCPSRRFLFGPL